MDAIARGLATRALAEIALIDTGQPVELRTTSTHLQWRRVGQPDWQNLVPLVDTGSALDFDWDGTSLGVKREKEEAYVYTDLIGPQGIQGIQGEQGVQGEQGIQGIQGIQGEPGPGLEFTWNGTQLGVRVEGESTYTYVDLRGPQGDTGPPGPAVTAGAGLTKTGDEISVDGTVVRTGGDQVITGAKKFADRTEFGAAITEHVHAVGTGSSINVSLASIFTATLDANRTFTFTGLPAGGTGKSFVLVLTHSGAGRAVTWPATVRWPDGEAPELSDSDGGIDVLSFVTYNNGTTWLGFLGGVGFA